MRPTLLAFSLLGFYAGFWQVLIADLAASLAINKGQLGLALSFGVVCSLLPVLVGGKLVDRLGTNRVIPLTAALVAAGLCAVALVPSYGWLYAALPIYMSASSLYCIAINAVAMSVEQQAGKPILSYFHAAFSGNGAIGALLAGGLLQAGIPFHWLYGLPALLLLGFAAIIYNRHFYPRRDKVEITDPVIDPPKNSMFRHPVVLLCALLVAAALIGESTLESWSVIYLREFVKLPIWLGASGVAIFHAAMFTGRMASGSLLKRIPRRRYLMVAGLVGAGGMALALGSFYYPLILLGFFFVGLSFSGVVPVAYSLAGDEAPDRVGEASSVISFIGNSFFAPGLVGLLAEAFSLRLALGVVLLCACVVSLIGWRLRAARVAQA